MRIDRELENSADRYMEAFLGSGERRTFELYLFEANGGWMLEERYKDEDRAIKTAEWFVKNGTAARVLDSEEEIVWEELP